MCHKATARAVLFCALLGAPWITRAQQLLDWRKIGPNTAELALASPATGPVARVWFSPDGSTLFARTLSGRTFQTGDFETWSPAPDATPPVLPPASAIRLPEDGAILVASPDGMAVFALKRNLYRSDDGGRSWENLTANKTAPVIGAGQHSVALWPVDPSFIVVGNDFGVWRSTDGGLTWAGLNHNLPNLPVRRVVSEPASGAGAIIQTDGWGALELPPGTPEWTARPGPTAVDAESAQRTRLSETLGTEITAVASAGDMVYAGSADGRLWFSSDRGRSFVPSTAPAGVSGPITRIIAVPSEPRAALATAAGRGIHVLRTFSGGDFWDAMDSNLPDAPAYAVTADAGAGQVYIGTARGVFGAALDLLTSSPAPAWTDYSQGLPIQNVSDVRLDAAGAQLYVALEGYGVYAVMAPHYRLKLRVLNAADFSSRPAAPGSLLSVSGALVRGAQGAGLTYPVLGVASEAGSQIQVPFAAIGPRVDLALQTTTGSMTIGLTVQPVSPAIFVATDGSPMLYDADTELPVDARNPAHSGGRVQIFATGLGRVTPDFAAGVPAPVLNPPAVAAQITAYLNGTPLQVTRATLAPGYIGFYLVEVQLPAVANFGSSTLYIAGGGQESNRVPILIEP